jgi:hypothetical protein
MTVLLAVPPDETNWVPPLIWAHKSLLPEEMVSTPPPRITVEVAVPTRKEAVPLMLPEPPTPNWPPELTVVPVIVAPSIARPLFKIVVPVAVPEKLCPEMLVEPTINAPPELTVVLIAVFPSNIRPPELITAPLTNPPSNRTPPLEMVGFRELPVPPSLKTISVPPLRMISPLLVPVAVTVWPLLTITMEPLEKSHSETAKLC